MDAESAQGMAIRYAIEAAKYADVNTQSAPPRCQAYALLSQAYALIAANALKLDK